MKKKLSKKTMIILCVSIAILLIIIGLIIWGNTALEINRITLKSEKLPNNFDGYKIAHISDLHNAELGKDNQKLIDMLNTAEPDIIVITGDMLDTRRPGYANNLSFAEKASEIAPCYFIPGNHEAKSKEYDELKNGLINSGITILENEKTELVIGDEKIMLYGICDPLLKNDNLSGNSKTITQKRLNLLKFDENSFNILLSHRPELFELYTEYDVDIVLSGHAHGGQFRLPFIGGIFAPNQGLFPDYDSGLYTKDGTNMIVSRGLGKSIIPFRINNRPEIVLIELQKK